MPWTRTEHAFNISSGLPPILLKNLTYLLRSGATVTRASPKTARTRMFYFLPADPAVGAAVQAAVKNGRTSGP